MSDTPREDTGSQTSFAVERFNPGQHQTAGFHCGRPELDTYIQSTVLRDEADRSAVTYVLVDTNERSDARRVIGYFTLNSSAFPREQGRRRDRDRNLGAYNPVPSILIGRLALDSSFQGQGLGSVLIFEALFQALTLSEVIGAAAVVVHALDEKVARFYEYQGFTRFRDKPLNLYYPLKTFIRAIPPARRAARP